MGAGGKVALVIGAFVALVGFGLLMVPVAMVTLFSSQNNGTVCLAPGNSSEEPVEVAASTGDGPPAASAQYMDEVRAAVAAYGEGVPQLTVPLMAGLIEAESGWDQGAGSGAGAIGLTQLMPGTARGLGVNPHNATENIIGGTKYLAEQLRRFGDVKLALAAYNAGPGAVSIHGGIPPYAETRAYVPRVLANAQKYGDVGAGVECIQVAGTAIINGDVACPMGAPHHFTDTWGAPRSGGRSHKGVDIFADIGIPNYAYTSGVVRLSSSSLGGISLWITADNGDRMYYAHLSGYAPGLVTGSRVETGQLVGFTGKTGNARYTPPHTHWEFHPGGNGPVNPTPYANAACQGAG